MIRKPNIFFLLVLLTSCVLVSCVEEIDFEDQYLESKLVVNALFDNESPWAVEISKTAAIFNPNSDTEKITFARVEIFDQNDEFLYELYHQGDGIYGREDYGPSAKRGYSIKVSATGYRAVTAKGFVPEKSTLLINNFSIIPNEKKNDVEVDFEIEDKSKLESYYIWEIVNIGNDIDGGADNGSSQFSDTWIDELTNNPIDLVSKNREFLGNGSFGDGTYQGTYSTLDGNRRFGHVNSNSSSGISTSATLIEDLSETAKMDPTLTGYHEVDPNDNTLTEGDDGTINEDDPIVVTYNYELRVMTISKELYNYYSSLEAYYQKGDNSHSGEAPFKFYTNVNNGAGIFAGFSESVIQF